AGARRRIAGRVCMDQFVLDVGDDPVAAGDEVVLFGPGDRGEPTAQEWAGALGTISYEIVTRIGARVPRSYPGGTARSGARGAGRAPGGGAAGPGRPGAPPRRCGPSGGRRGGTAAGRPRRPTRSSAGCPPTGTGSSGPATAPRCTSRRSGRRTRR